MVNPGYEPAAQGRPGELPWGERTYAFVFFLGTGVCVCQVTLPESYRAAVCHFRSARSDVIGRESDVRAQLGRRCAPRR